MKRGFTLLELLVVIIILGILATLGLTQYGSTVERTRGAEARAILGLVRFQAIAFRLEKGDIFDFTSMNAGIGSSLDQVPDTCRPSHYFSYNFAVSDPVITISATRCTAGGKTPQYFAATTLELVSDLVTGVDSWSGTGNY
jgi:prepilin-type N-terminal cleavage/methylation domain-containing protein